MDIAANGDVRNKELRLELNGRRYDYHVTAVILKHGEHEGEQLFVLHDITALKDAQGKHNRLMESIIQTIVGLTDVHDPHCANHSERTRVVSVVVAKALELAPERISSLAMAAQLANIGKLYVPAELLTSDEPLTDKQSLLLRQSSEHSVRLLEGLDFEGDVIKFVKQKNECLDGSGYPKGLAGDEILMESRILAVANAFVAMSSSRAYRAGMSIDKVMAALSEQVGQRYDEKVVAALMRVTSEHKEWVDWQGVK
jgi:HD-GYP domain-containing protein (c-di-GMP phosphodiesterase class II)